MSPLRGVSDRRTRTTGDRPSACGLFIFLGLVLAVWVGAGRATSAELVSARREALDRFVGQFVELAMFDGNLLVDVGGEVVYERSFGLAHYELAVPHGPGTRFRVASVSKTVTDAAFAVLIQRGVLELETPLSRFLPDFPAADAITIGHLLSHTSGIPHTNDQPWGDGKTSLGLDEIVARLADLPLDFEPGSDSSYSNGGYAVAARVLEIVAGGHFDAVLRELVFEPLAMADSGHIADARSPIDGMATGYEPGRHPGERRHARFYAVETRPGGGSLYSTTRDLHRFAVGVFRRDFIRPDLRASVLGAGEEGLLSQGRSPGFIAKLWYGAANDVIVVSLSNNYAVPADWARAIAGIATGRTLRPWPELRRAPDAVPADDPRLGDYRSSRGGRELRIERNDRGAMVQVDPESESITGLVPLADGGFLLPLYFQRCEQAADDRTITCRMLSGNERYTSELTPIGG